MANRYAIEYEPEAVEHLGHLTARDQACVLDEVDRQLRFQPWAVTRHRKPLRKNSLYPRQLSVGDLRIYYDVVEAPEKVVMILAVGVKRGNRLWIGGEEIRL